ncbi:hypothetical protein EYF80_037984 [Liparis tanakae]|uniref:Uncharacterized protein n=1 Tax=Liparis tanakae TaxID=230148 RepID=A0A4Z2GE12_9TELE|nr:hypothetical protein EYF80_037984 [Liparis tanakae]
MRQSEEAEGCVLLKAAGEDTKELWTTPDVKPDATSQPHGATHSPPMSHRSARGCDPILALSDTATRRLKFGREQPVQTDGGQQPCSLAVTAMRSLPLGSRNLRERILPSLRLPGLGDLQRPPETSRDLQRPPETSRDLHHKHIAQTHSD